MIQLCSIIACTILLIKSTLAFRIHIPNVTVTPAVFTPYQTGFVGVQYEPSNPYFMPGNPGK